MDKPSKPKVWSMKSDDIGPGCFHPPRNVDVDRDGKAHCNSCGADFEVDVIR